MLPLLLLLVTPILASQWAVSSDPPKQRVNVTLYVMSRCPDARLCESVFDTVLAHPGIYDKIDLRMNYIAYPNRSEPLGYSCKHGEKECIGNAHQLCLYRHLPIKVFYANLVCQNYDSPGEIGSVKLTKRCMEATKQDWEGVRGCIGSEGELKKEAKELFRKNVESTIRANVSRSCTIRIGSTIKHGYRQCVVDGGVWKGCDDGHSAGDFIRVIEEEYKRL